MRTVGEEINTIQWLIPPILPIPFFMQPNQQIS